MVDNKKETTNEELHVYVSLLVTSDLIFCAIMLEIVMGHGSQFMWVNGLMVTPHDPLLTVLAPPLAIAVLHYHPPTSTKVSRCVDQHKLSYQPCSFSAEKIKHRTVHSLVLTLSYAGVPKSHQREDFTIISWISMTLPMILVPDQFLWLIRDDGSG